MELSTLHLTVMTVATLGLITQAMAKNKQLSHMLFAVFCVSIIFVATQKLSAGSIGAYQYLIGMFACATCNGYWLFARTIFRKHNPISLPHVLAALAIALLTMLNQGYLFAIHQWQLPVESLSLGKSILSEATVMLSSCILLLTVWEGCRGFNQVSKVEKQQRLLFITSIALAIVIAKIAKVQYADTPNIIDWITSSLTLYVLAISQILLFWKTKTDAELALQEKLEQEKAANDSISDYESDPELLNAVNNLLVVQQWYLQPNLKVGDLAKELDVPEYRISKIFRFDFQAPNFNHHINNLRIEHAKRLLIDPDKQQWPVLVVGLESGFASVGPFSRAFKNFTGQTPNQFRLDKVKHSQILNQAV